MTTSLTKRLTIIAITLLLFQGGALLLLARAKSSDVRPLNSELNKLPYDIGTWHGKDQKIDDEIVKTVGARHAISRTYVNTEGRGITVHIADWDSLKTPTLPHPPTICYPASGAEIISRGPITVDGPDPNNPDPINAELLTIDKDGSRSLVLYWYAWNETVCTTRFQATMARLQMIGSRQWPPVVKVMLETPIGTNKKDAKKVLTQFASQIRQLTKGL